MATAAVRTFIFVIITVNIALAQLEIIKHFTRSHGSKHKFSSARSHAERFCHLPVSEY